jgi:hypothetical protein
VVRETRHHVAAEARGHRAPLADRPGERAIFWRTTLGDRDLSSVTQAGRVNNLNDGMAWGLFPLFYAGAGIDLGAIGTLAAIYPATWGVAQLATGAWSDRVGRKWLIAGGMWVQAIGIAVIVRSSRFAGFATGAALLGVGTAMVYPTLLAAIGDVAHPSWRASAVGVYRLWRDLGYAIGALLAGLSDARARSSGVGRRGVDLPRRRGGAGRMSGRPDERRGHRDRVEALDGSAPRGGKSSSSTCAPRVRRPRRQGARPRRRALDASKSCGQLVVPPAAGRQPVGRGAALPPGLGVRARLSAETFATAAHPRIRRAMNTLFVVSDAPCRTERAYNALRLAASVAKHEANRWIFLVRDAAACTGRSARPERVLQRQDMLKNLVRHGGGRRMQLVHGRARAGRRAPGRRTRRSSLEGGRSGPRSRKSGGV